MLTVAQAAERLGVSRALVYSLIAARKLRHVRVGLGRGVIRIPEEALAEFQRGCVIDVAEPRPAPRPRIRLNHLKLD